MVILSEKEINEDLKRNLVGLGVDLDSLVDERNALIPLRKEDVIRNYSCGYYLRKFILQEGRMSYSSQEILPVIFRPTISVKKLYNMVGQGKGSRGLNDLENVGIIKVGLFVDYKTTIKINDFDTIKDRIVNYIWEQKGVKKSKIARKFDERLGILRNEINRISEITTLICDEFYRWYRRKMSGDSHKRLEEFVKNYIHSYL